MASPTTTSNGYSIGGSSTNAVTTVVWGTDGLLTTPVNNSTTKSPGGTTYAGTGFYIVESVDQETDAEVIYIENGTGQKVARVIINNGQKWTLSVQDDTAMASPIIGNTVGIKDGAGLIGAIGLTYKAVIIANGERFTRKGAAMRNLTVESLLLVDGQTGV